MDKILTEMQPVEILSIKRPEDIPMGPLLALLVKRGQNRNNKNPPSTSRDH